MNLFITKTIVYSIIINFIAVFDIIYSRSRRITV